MTVNEYLEMYKVGIEIGIITIDELEDFIYGEIERLDNVPYCYIDVLDAVHKGVKEVTKRIDDHFWQCGYTQQCALKSDNVCHIERILIGKIAEQYKNGENDMKTVIYDLDKLSSYFHLYWATVRDTFELAEQGYRTSKSVQEELDEIFDMAVYDY